MPAELLLGRSSAEIPACLLRRLRAVVCQQELSAHGKRGGPAGRGRRARRPRHGALVKAVMKTILLHANLIDCVEPRVRPNTAVLIEDGRICAILPSGETKNIADAQVIDLEGGYLMPGLWDVHIHPDYLTVDAMPLADQVTLFGHRLATALIESGMVGMRCAGTHSFVDVAWKRAFDSGQHVGPRLFACGHFLTTTGGHFLTSGRSEEHTSELQSPYV